MMLPKVLIGAVGATLIGCDQPGRGAVTVQDSAGVRIVTSYEPLWDDGEEWRVAASPRLRLGAADGAAAEQFSRVRGIGRLHDGSIAVADGASHKLRLFAPDGSFLRRSGRQGKGPGEFGRLARMLVTGQDTILTWDSSNRRITLFSSHGLLAREEALPPEVSPGVELVGRFNDGSLVVAPTSTLLGGEAAGVTRHAHPTIRLSPQGIDTLVIVPGFEYLTEISEYVSSLEIPYARDAFAAVCGDRLFLGSNDRFEVTQHDPEGRMISILRLPPANVPITPAEAEELEQLVIAYLNPAPGRRARIQRLFREVPRPEFEPAFSGLLCDTEGNLWVAEWVSGFAPPQYTPRRWRVFRSDGRFLGAVEMPMSFRPYQIGSDFLIGLSRDSLEVEHVDLYDLIK